MSEIVKNETNEAENDSENSDESGRCSPKPLDGDVIDDAIQPKGKSWNFVKTTETNEEELKETPISGSQLPVWDPWSTARRDSIDCISSDAGLDDCDSDSTNQIASFGWKNPQKEQ